MKDVGALSAPRGGTRPCMFIDGLTGRKPALEAPSGVREGEEGDERRGDPGIVAADFWVVGGSTRCLGLCPARTACDGERDRSIPWTKKYKYFIQYYNIRCQPSTIMRKFPTFCCLSRILVRTSHKFGLI